MDRRDQLGISILLGAVIGALASADLSDLAAAGVMLFSIAAVYGLIEMTRRRG